MRSKLQNARLYKTALSSGLPQGSLPLGGALVPRAPPLGRSLSPHGSPPLGGTLVPKAFPAWAEPCFSDLKLIKMTPLNNDSRKVQLSEQPATRSEQLNLPLPPPHPLQNMWCPHFKNCSAGLGFSRFPDSVSLKRKNEALACPTPLINAVSL